MPPQILYYISSYGYLAIFLLVFLQEIGVPIPLPNELLMLFSGYLVFKGVLLFSIVVLVIILADFLATMALYNLFYYAGNYIISNKPKWFPLSDIKLNSLRSKISKGGLWMVAICRLTPFIRGYTSVISGLIHIKPRIFIPIALLSSILFCGFYVTSGKFFGPYWNQIIAGWSVDQYYILSVVLLILAAYTIVKLNKHYKDKKRMAEDLKYETDQLLTVHMISETAYVTQGQGVHTAFLELVELLKDEKNIRIVINNEGTGNVFHSHTYGPYYFWKGQRYKGRRIITAHVIPDSSRGAIPFWKQLLPITNLYLKLAYSFADVVVAISPMVEKAIKDMGVKTSIVRIYNPVLIENWARTAENRKKGRKILGIKPDEKLILGVGQLQERKGVEDFIDMAAAMPGSKFVWVGGRPWGKFTEGIRRINNRIENAPSNIFFTGLKEIEDMPPMYAAADIFLFPSYQENCPLAPLEAAASGLPVVFRDIQEYSTLYQLPYLKATDTAEFIKITQQLLNDQDYYNEAVKISGKLVEKFDKNKIRAEFLDLYTQVFSNANKGNLKPLSISPVISHAMSENTQLS